MAPYVLQSPCTVDDVAGLARNNVSAFWDETWWRLLWNDRRTVDSLIDAVTIRTPKNLLTDRDVRRHQKVVDSDSGLIVGYARWILPVSHQSDWLEAQALEVSEDQRDMFSQRHAQTDFSTREDMDDLDRHVHEWNAKYNHGQCLMLDYLAVRPDHHRRGVGSMLVQSGVKKANELGLDIFLVAMGRRALGMYLKAGFDLVDQHSDSLLDFGADEMYETFCLIKRARV
ncbi:hypothetical protein B0T10DRAFT_537468 [Thelonectria olida]|uniref:N-acetyltransferase domain-containing protein n=1 Tax=Thelonectria olida TaxID=1576542 RepID=A0A9P8W7L6_9HYPO|nr:hypothetical protein B0T10DRAFT_537468 [Thelonectria olida]